MHLDNTCELCGPDSRNPYLAGTHEHWEWCREAAINSAGLGKMSLWEFDWEATRRMKHATFPAPSR